MPVFLITFCLLQGVSGTTVPISPADFPEIPIYVEETWSVPYATDIQDISFNWNTYTLVIRSNGSGKIFLADPATCDSTGEVNLPAGSEGFGVAVNYSGSGDYYINSSTSDSILYCDGSDSWTGFANPAGTSGAGMDMYSGGSATLCEALNTVPCGFYNMDPDGSGSTLYGLPGIGSEISGFMGHDVATRYGSPPWAIITTTRFGHEFFFLYEGSGSYVVYGQEPCPLSVSESLGLTWSPDGAVYWSYKGLDNQYYISKLQIPVFGGIEDTTQGTGNTSRALEITSNPSRGSAGIAVNLIAGEQVVLDVYDLSGRLVETLYNGQLASGENTFSFSGCSGIFTAVLRHCGQEEMLKFVLSD
ncbi:hypothetical protein DRQ21_09450 [Candidatus Fermentibacteria bacterium]|nr:MAG: hypothetical protein DRQ21_09450 [Candidatus Fermentibacteria bacterium]